MLCIELLSILLCKFSHFDIANSKPILLNHIDNFANIKISIRFYHCKCFSLLIFKFVFRELISKIYNFQLSRKHINSGSNKNIFQLHRCILTPFKKHFSSLYVKHFNCIVFQIVNEVIVTNKRGC